MILFPAVDIKDGKCVRLKQGLADQVTVFSDNPLDAALKWRELGAEYLHVVDLDGAFGGVPRNFDLVSEICGRLDVPVQLGGGVRDLETARSYLEAGVERLIIGTLALADPLAFEEMCRELPGRIGVSLDAQGGRLKTRGWVEDSGQTVFDVLPRMERAETAFIVYTDISRDGMQSGVNFEALEALCRETDLPVIAAGGVTDLEDVKRLRPLTSFGLAGAITGRAIYEGTLDFKEALAWLKSQE
jgi:phosphoribosylformimino-5-aminoimidazole carboxamide ribotide isomerase